MATEEEIGFSFYEEKTVDPGWRLLVFVLCFCAIANGGLPFWMRWAHQLFYGWTPRTRRTRPTATTRRTAARRETQTSSFPPDTDNSCDTDDDSDSKLLLVIEKSKKEEETVNLLTENGKTRSPPKNVSSKTSSTPTTFNMMPSPDISEMSSVAVDHAKPLFDIMVDIGEDSCHTPDVIQDDEVSKERETANDMGVTSETTSKADLFPLLTFDTNGCTTTNNTSQTAEAQQPKLNIDNVLSMFDSPGESSSLLSFILNSFEQPLPPVRENHIDTSIMEVVEEEEISFEKNASTDEEDFGDGVSVASSNALSSIASSVLEMPRPTLRGGRHRTHKHYERTSEHEKVEYCNIGNAETTPAAADSTSDFVPTLLQEGLEGTENDVASASEAIHIKESTKTKTTRSAIAAIARTNLKGTAAAAAVVASGVKRVTVEVAKTAKTNLNGTAAAATAVAKGVKTATAEAAKTGIESMSEPLEDFLEIAAWDKDMKKIRKLAMPYTAQGFLDGLFSLAVVAVIGHLIGIREANAYVVTTILGDLTNTINYGFYEALGTLGPQAEGTANRKLVGQYLQIAMLFFALGGVPILLLWGLCTKPAILWLGFDEETARIGQSYAIPYTLCRVLYGIDMCLQEFLLFKGHEYYSLVSQTIQLGIQALVVVVMAGVAGARDLTLIGYLQAFGMFLYAAFNFIFVVSQGWLKDYWGGFTDTKALKNKKAVNNLLHTAIPLSLSYILTYGEWEVLTIFASFMGPAEVAAWGLLGYIWSLFELITEGISSAGEVRVGHYMGGGKPEKGKRAGYKTIYLAYAVAVSLTAIMYMFSLPLVNLVTPDPTLRRMIYGAIPLVGVSQIGLATSTVCWSVLGAQGRYRLATAVGLAGSWLVAIPLSAIFVGAFGWNLQGPVAALVMGYTMSGVTNISLVLTSDWKRLSDSVMAQNGSDSSPEYSSSSSSSGFSASALSSVLSSSEESPSFVSASSSAASSRSIYKDESLSPSSISSASVYRDDDRITRPVPDDADEKLVR